MTISDEQVAHDKAIAFAQATLLKDIEESEIQQSHGARKHHASILEQLGAFNYTYVEALKFFTEQKNRY